MGNCNGKEHGDDPAWDHTEAEAVYAALENEVIPEFYERNEKGLPLKWLGRIRESMARLTSEFSATRAIREYTENHYLPAASNYRERAAGNSAAFVGTCSRLAAGYRSPLEHGALRRGGNRDARRPAFLSGRGFSGKHQSGSTDSRTLRRLSSGRPTCPRGDDCTQTQHRCAGRADLYGPRILDSSRERLHCAHHTLSSQRICAARSTADPLATLIDKADQESRVRSAQ